MLNPGETYHNNYSLKRLYEYVGTDPVVVKDMVLIFIGSISESLRKMEACLELGDLKNFAKESHKIKTSLLIFGFDDQTENINLFEQCSDTLLNDARLRFDQFKLRLLSGVEALQHDFDLHLD
jgi:HPt (histidine-containing phosphotransfer) domain-containing protein